MFNYLFKSLPSKYLYAGYSIRKGLTVMTSEIDGKIIYDVFQYTYMDDYLSFYILMEDGTYKNVKENVSVPSLNAEEIISTHLYRGDRPSNEDYGEYDKNKIIGVFGLRLIDNMMKIIDDYEEKNNIHKNMKVQALYDIKGTHTGLEVKNILDRYNEDLKTTNQYFPIPAITKDINDTYHSVIGDEIEFFELMSNPNTDEIVIKLKELSLKDIKN